MRITIVGNCQVSGLEKSLQVLRPDVEVDAQFMQSLAERFPTRRSLYEHLRRSDHVFFHKYEEEQFYGYAEDLQREVSAIREVPFITFNGFHPDMVYVNVEVEGGRAMVKSPVGDNHSALVVMAYKLGLGPQQAKALFCEQVFRRVGYLTLWRNALAALKLEGDRTGCPLDRLFVRWTRRGSFMHTINHPKIHVLADIARWMLAAARVPFDDAAVEELVIDELMLSTIWPVYEELAPHLGMRGSYRFKREIVSSYIDLSQFVEESFRVYARYAPEVLESWPPNTWIEDPALCAYLREIARS